ncbi:MAG: hypothetical protein KA051_02815 [Paludibacteraceae bacterium]|jgi:3-hydroxyacyl-[acyl-carrier-protein] dehydratase|nr:hypothetical protein [Paludibacteraceae bacterium]
MLLDNYFYIEKQEKDEEDFLFLVRLNTEHPIFNGHFPGNPISPGVCNIQMIKECAERIMGCQLRLDNIKQCKFSNLIIPSSELRITISIRLQQIEGDRIKLHGIISTGDIKNTELKAEGKMIL